ncbi:MAG: hypothetical protein IPP91_11145 [Betaproteobacteria bacterium]|nr:hypothetical protein [Betaproteobacteria bacterium]
MLGTCLTGSATSHSWDGANLIIVKDGVPDVVQLGTRVRRKMLQWISKRYGINIEFFYHPHMCAPGSGTAQ